MPKKLKLYTERTVYKAKKGTPYDPDNRQFDCYMLYAAVVCPPTHIADCWVCDSEGNVHPGYNVSPVPVYLSNLGKIVKEL